MDIFKRKIIIFVITLLLSLTIATEAADKLPIDKAGEINPPTGKIAFTRDGNIWIMNSDGSKQETICESINSDGRLSWSPDNKKIIFTRSGAIDLKGPDNLGGKHKVYDLFLCYLDSAYANKRLYWRRLTDDLGSRNPEWSAAGDKIIFWKDINANKANSFSPNYQLCSIDSEGDNFEYLRKDWQNLYDAFLISPSMNKNGDIVFVYFLKQRRYGLVVLPSSKLMTSLDSIQVLADDSRNFVAPAWSPDNKWIAMVNNDLNNAGLYIASADLKQKYLVTAPPVGTYLHTISPSFSPDSKWLTFSTTDGSIWTCDITGNGLRRLTGPGNDKGPSWSK